VGDAGPLSRRRRSLFGVAAFGITRARAIFIAIFIATAVALGGASAAQALTPRELGIVVNDADPLSRQIGAYYARVRQVPAANIVHVNLGALAPPPASLAAADFERARVLIDAKLPAGVQALLLTWVAPYRVECMSITSAFAFGFDPAYCAEGCKVTKTSPYFDSETGAPWRDFRMRPAMSLAARDFPQAKALIDRGLAASRAAAARTAGRARNAGTVYLVSTPDAARNVRAAPQYPAAERILTEQGIAVQVVQAPGIAGRRDVLGYFTGALSVPDLETNRFVPGAVADHLTSAGGDLLGKGDQMPALRWLEAGATASYGAVVEPCNFTQKFPNVRVFVRRYFAQHDSLIESYWKSVLMPGQGIFIGDPLAQY
jgi:uncharacterized protein (TIGR03790 family)